MPKTTVTKTTSTTTNSDGEDRTVEQYRTIPIGIAEAIDDTARALLNAALNNVVDDYEEGDLSITGGCETA